MAMATSKMVTPAFPAPHKQGCADPDTNEFSCDEMICSEFNMMIWGGALGPCLSLLPITISPLVGATCKHSVKRK